MISSGKKIKPAAKRPLIYCGPNLPKGVLLRFTIFREGAMPEYFKKHIESCPAIGRLCVPVADMAKTLQAIEQKGTAESVWFGQVQEYMKGGGK